MQLDRYLGMSADFWMKAPMQYDLEKAIDNNLAAIRREVRPASRDRRTEQLKHQATA